ncbi:energy-coupling factor ABC transporter ATP-binding protein [Spirillospora sp. CA-255316]
MIELRNITHGYGGRPVLHDISLRLEERRIGLIGANGSGKSTLARLLNGLILPDSGQVLVDGLDTRRRGRAVRRKVGFVFPDAGTQIIMPTVAEDVAIGLRNRGLSKEEVAARTTAVLAEHGLAAHHDHPAHLLSGGQKQMLALAAVLVTEPEILVCDEPTTLLDRLNVRTVIETLRSLPQQVILLTHQLETLEGFDRVLVVGEGRVLFDGPPGDAIDRYIELIDAEAAPAGEQAGEPIAG